jgi:hypothetical protein
MTELQKILGYLNLGLAIAHNTGVTVGHFGSTDFIQLAQVVNSVLLDAVTPSTTGAVATSAAVVATPAIAVAVASSPVAN